MKNLESCIIKMNEVAALIRMIDDTFVSGRIGFSDDKDGEQLEDSLNLLRAVWHQSGKPENGLLRRCLL